MSAAATGIVALVSISVVCAVLAHLLIRRMIVAAFVASLIASFLFQIAATIHLGHMDKFVLIAFVVGAFWAFLIGLVVGSVLRWHDRPAG